MEWKRNSRRRFISRTPLFYFFICILLCIIGARTVYLDTIRTSVTETNNSYIQEFEKITEKKGENEEEIPSTKSISRSKWFTSFRFNRRHLSGLGSYPPRCTAKCGKCTPCKPVHVPVPPGTSAPTEYYPEAWRCKCGNKLYMP